jgi:hypothetical protein
MIRSMHLTGLVLAVLLGGPRWSAARQRPAPLYSLPVDGTWVEHEWKGIGPDSKEQAGLLRISSVGTAERKGLRCRWVEVRKTVKNRARGQHHWRKLLVAEGTFARSRALRGSVIECWEQEKAGGPVTRLTRRRLEDFLGMGFGGSEAHLALVRDNVEVETEVGKRSVKLVSVRAKVGKRALEHRGWLTEEVPFGWARFEIWEATGKIPPRRLFQAVVARTGQGARSEVGVGGGEGP